MSLRPKKIKYKIQLSSKKDGTEETILPSQNISSIPVETTPIVSKSSNVAFATAFSKPAIYSSTTPKSLMPGDEFISIYQPHYKTTESGLNLPDGVQESEFKSKINLIIMIFHLVFLLFLTPTQIFTHYRKLANI